ncbi:MAG TPA: hypothetical protein VIL38_02145, partial [Thermaerobacter sp.]
MDRAERERDGARPGPEPAGERPKDAASQPAGAGGRGAPGAGGGDRRGPSDPPADGSAERAGSGAITDAEALMDLYYEVSMEGVDLRRFLDRLDAGEWGPVDPQVVVDFLRDLEAVILSNVDVKAMEGPEYAGRRMEVIEETQREFEELVARYL